MDRCNELCTKEATGYCALCAALADRERFIAWWMKGGVLRAGMRAVQPSHARAIEAHKAVLWRTIAALWHQGQWAVLDEVMAPTVVSHTSHTGEDGGRAVHGLDGIERWWQRGAAHSRICMSPSTTAWWMGIPWSRAGPVVGPIKACSEGSPRRGSVSPSPG